MGLMNPGGFCCLIMGPEWAPELQVVLPGMQISPGERLVIKLAFMAVASLQTAHHLTAEDRVTLSEKTGKNPYSASLLFHFGLQV